VEDEYYEEGRQLDYKSDYDFLIITKSGDRRSDYEVQEIVERRSGLNTHVSAITHDIDYINSKLSDGQYFFSEIEEEGILLFDAGNTPLAEKRILTSPEKKEFAQNDFDLWFTSAQNFLKGARFYLIENDLNIAAFLLHQSAERTLNTAILVFRGYKPKTHNLDKLFRYAKHFGREMVNIFPRNNLEEKHIFDLLKKGYVEARYDKKYVITKEEVEELIKRIEKLQEIVERICKEKILSFT
jgi:HEPN domain-containing protein